MRRDQPDPAIEEAREVVRHLVLDRWSDFTTLPATVSVMNEAFDHVLRQTATELSARHRPGAAELLAIAEETFRHWEVNYRRRL